MANSAQLQAALDAADCARASDDPQDWEDLLEQLNTLCQEEAADS